MTTMHWWRCMHGAPFDPKWRVVALAAKTEPGKVWAVVSALYDRASQSKDRGDVAGAGMDEIAEGFGWPVDDVQRIYSALKAKAVIIDNRIASWEKHQPKRERPADSSAERVRRHREKKKAEALALHGVTSVTSKQGSVTPNVTPPVTVRNGPVTDVTNVTVLPPLHRTGEAQTAAKNGYACNATVTPGNAQRREDSFLLSSNSETVEQVEPLLVRTEREPLAKPASKSISSKRERGTRWPAGQAVPPDWIAASATNRAKRGLPQIDLVLEAEKFTNYWTAKSGQSATKVDWSAAWRMWSLNAYGANSNGRSNGNAGQSRSVVFDDAIEAYNSARAEREFARH